MRTQEQSHSPPCPLWKQLGSTPKWFAIELCSESIQHGQSRLTRRITKLNHVTSTAGDVVHNSLCVVVPDPQQLSDTKPATSHSKLEMTERLIESSLS